MRAGSTDRNLLFGILALQMDFISREQLIAGMHAWVLRKERPLGMVLRDQQALSEQRHQLLDALVEEHLEQHEGDPAKSLASLSAVGSVKEELNELGDSEIAESILHLGVVRRAEDDPHATRTWSVGESTSLGQRFRILRPHAQGGLGTVSLARDEELHREVALKEIRPEYADDLERRARFTLEAEITGGLEHPGIVPVYGLGNYADGRPFYAMRFIKGDSLKEAIERFHKADENPKRNPGEQSLELRKLLGRFIDVCHAIEYAHSRGVLHRDLKPGNIMLGKYGETLVVDWGLAKAQGRDEHLPDLAGEPALQPVSGSEIEPTQMGAMVGTLAYMSPEQATGRLDLLGPATDVYSLGATLFQVLTGKPPITGEDRDELLRNAQMSQFPRPRTLNKSIPPAVEAICLKAMAREPKERYHTPLAIVDDLEHWLADEPTSALRETFADRVGRIGRRHRVWTQAIGVALILIAAVSTVSGIIVEQKRREASQLAVEKNKLAVHNARIAVERAGLVTKERNSRREAETQTRLAVNRLAISERSRYVAQLALIAAILDTNPSTSLTLLEDEHVCPQAQRDFVWRMYHRLARKDRQSWQAHQGRVTFLALPPDNSALYSAGFDGMINVWHPATKKLVTSSIHTAAITAGLILPDGSTMATGDEAGNVTLWELPSVRPLITSKLFDSAVNDVAVTSDGLHLAACSAVGIAICNAEDGMVVQRHTSNTGKFWSLAFHRNKRMLIAAGARATAS